MEQKKEQGITRYTAFQLSGQIHAMLSEAPPACEEGGPIWRISGKTESLVMKTQRIVVFHTTERRMQINEIRDPRNQHIHHTSKRQDNEPNLSKTFYLSAY